MADNDPDPGAALTARPRQIVNDPQQASWLLRLGLASWSIIGIAAVLVVSLAVC
jgi:hypothetical protein